MAVTRWREDATCDDWGSYVFLGTSAAATVWSAGYQPSGTEPDAYDVVFNEDRAEITRHDGTLTTTMEVLVSAEDDAEVRRVSITNSGSRVREIDVTSYAELVLAPQAADIAHPAFIETVRRKRSISPTSARSWRHGGGASPTEPEIWAAHLASWMARAVGNAGNGNRPRPVSRPRPRHSHRRSR